MDAYEKKWDIDKTTNNYNDSSVKNDILYHLCYTQKGGILGYIAGYMR